MDRPVTCPNQVMVWNCRCGLRPGHTGPCWCPVCNGQWTQHEDQTITPVATPEKPHPES